jgi:hypothetical protein
MANLLEAESFMFFLRHKGELPPRFASHVIKEWRFIADRAEVVSSDGTRW